MANKKNKPAKKRNKKPQKTIISPATSITTQGNQSAVQSTTLTTKTSAQKIAPNRPILPQRAARKR